ncbi:AMP-binding protein [Mycobacterium sp. NPDC003323]
MPEIVDLLAGRGEHPLLICDAERLTYGDADRRSADLARGLLALSAGKGTHIGLLYPNGPDFVVGMLAAARIGAVVVPYSTFLTAAELRTQLLDSDTAIMLSAHRYRGRDFHELLAEAGPTPCLRHTLFGPPDDLVAPAMLADFEADVDGCDPLAIVYTSGSNGPPKGAVHTHAGLIGHQHNLNAIRGLTDSDVLFCNSPFFWIGGFCFGLLATLAAGATLLCSNNTDAGATLVLLEADRPTITNSFAAGIAHLTRHSSYPDRRFTAPRGKLNPIMAADVPSTASTAQAIWAAWTLTDSCSTTAAAMTCSRSAVRPCTRARWKGPVVTALPIDALRTATKELISGFKVPTVWLHSDDLPIGATGKVDKQRVRMMLSDDGVVT